MIKVVSEGKTFLFDTQRHEADSGYVTHHVTEHFNEFSDDRWLDAEIAMHDGHSTIRIAFDGDARSIEALRRVIATTQEVIARIEEFIKVGSKE